MSAPPLDNALLACALARKRLAQLASTTGQPEVREAALAAWRRIHQCETDLISAQERDEDALEGVAS